MTTNDNMPSCSTLAKGNQPEQLGNNDLAIAVGLALLKEIHLVNWLTVCCQN